MSEMNLKKLAAKLTAVASRKQLDNKDLEALREIKEGVAAALVGLKECDCCGAAVTDIARLEIDGVRASVCQGCGIKALKNKELVIKNVRKKEAAKAAAASASRAATTSNSTPKSAAKTALKSKPFKTETPVEERTASTATRTRTLEQTTLFGEPVSTKAEKGDSAFEAVATECGAKLMNIKKIHQIASGIAFPMNLERTLGFVRMEAQSQHVQVHPDEQRRIVLALQKKGLLRIKD